MRGMWRGLAGAVIGLAMALTAQGAAAEQVLNRGNPGEPSTLDPANVSINVEFWIVKDLWEGLVIYDAAGKVVPGTAESWTLSDDGKTYTFKIRANAKWSDGTPVTAEDFAFSLRRLEDPATASKYANILYPIKNAEQVNTGKLPQAQLGVKAVDDKTLEITLERATPFFLELLTHATALPVNKASVEKYGKDFNKLGKIVSNGAFKLSAHVPNDSLTMVKNENYWDAANVKLDKVIFYPIEDQAASVRRFEAKEMDLVYNFSAVELPRLRKAYGDEVNVAPSLSTYYYVFDTRKVPFNDVRVRRALSMAIDRDYLVDKIYNGSQLASYSMVPPGIAGYGEPSKADFADMSQLDREDKALELMKEAGYGEGGKPLEIQIRFNTNPNHERIATAIADMWKRLFGAKVSLMNLDVTSHYAYLQEGGAFDVARAGWSSDYADAENFLALNVSTNKTFNYAKYNNPEFDALMQKSYDERDPAARAKILHEAETIMLKDQPVAPLLSQAELWLVNSRVKGFVGNAVNEHLSKFMSVTSQ